MKELRKKINEIDGEIIQLLAKRLALSPGISQWKKEKNLSIQDKKREKEIIKELKKEAGELNVSPALINKNYLEIFAESRRIQEESA